MTKTTYGIGIDTGGTYTDAVLLNLNDNTIIGTAKSPTTHHQLSHGIALALRDLMVNCQLKSPDISLVAVSTTLATNAVVENKGDKVGLIVAGHNRPLDLPVVSSLFIEGGHNLQGQEDTPLDMEALVRAVSQLKGNVDAYVLCSAMSIKNPTHEMVMGKAVQMIDQLPVFLSHEVSNRPGIHDRAATAVLNARLRPIMEEFLLGMQDGLVALGMAGNVKIIRGDAKTMNIADTPRHAASTVASGPAATAWFGLQNCPETNGLIVDIGGTTTDITMIRNGQPTLTEDGSKIGNWRTHINSVKMSTVGAGGDSHATVSPQGQLTVGPARVTPLALCPDSKNPQTWLGPGLKAQLVAISPDILEKEAANNEILAYLYQNGPTTPDHLKNNFTMSEFTINDHLKELIKMQLAWETGFTPTDAFIALGKLDLGDKEVATKAAEILGQALNMSGPEYAKLVIATIQQKIEDAILDHLLSIETGKTLSSFYPKYRHSEVIDFAFQLKIPIIGIGAAAQLLLPEVAKRLQTKAIFPPNFAVGNAVGAITMANNSERKSNAERN